MDCLKARAMGMYHSVCRTCTEELITDSVTDARQHTRAHQEQGHEAEFIDIAFADDSPTVDADA